MYLYLFNMLENRNVILEIAISHMVKFTILIGRNYLFDYIAQSNYCTIEIFNHSFLKNNIEKRTVASLINLKKIARISQGLQIRASNTNNMILLQISHRDNI